MQKLTVHGKSVGEFKTRAEALVAAFDRRLVYDQHSRKRNRLLPHVKIVGTDEEIGDIDLHLPLHPLDRIAT